MNGSEAVEELKTVAISNLEMLGSRSNEVEKTMLYDQSL